MSDIKLVLHFAVADNGVIGKDNDMPWHISSDLKRFKALTMGRPIVMGRRTYESIGRPLPGRTNIVVTRNADFSAEKIVVAHDLDEALDVARQDAQDKGVDEIAVIGGGAIYKALWDRAERLYVTHVHVAPEGDTYVPAIDPAQWEQVSIEGPVQGEKDSSAMSFAVYNRK